MIGVGTKMMMASSNGGAAAGPAYDYRFEKVLNLAVPGRAHGYRKSKYGDMYEPGAIGVSDDDFGGPTNDDYEIQRLLVTSGSEPPHVDANCVIIITGGQRFMTYDALWLISGGYEAKIDWDGSTYSIPSYIPGPLVGIYQHWYDTGEGNNVNFALEFRPEDLGV